MLKTPDHELLACKRAQRSYQIAKDGAKPYRDFGFIKINCAALPLIFIAWTKTVE